MFVNQKKLTLINTVWILNVVKRTCQEQWPIGMYGEKESRESVLSECLDDICKLE